MGYEVKASNSIRKRDIRIKFNSIKHDNDKEYSMHCLRLSKGEDKARDYEYLPDFLECL